MTYLECFYRNLQCLPITQHHEKVETADAGAGDDEEAPEAPKVLRNQFNFSERASQTFNYTVKVRTELMINP